MSKHTPGPWKITTSWNDFMVEGPNGEEIIWQDGNYDTPTISFENACLIAAAPDLLEALLSIEIYLSDTLSGRVNPDPATYKQWLIDGIIEVRHRARVAIAKATGKTNDQD